MVKVTKNNLKVVKSAKDKDLENKELISDKVGTEASIISKNIKIRKLVHSFQINFAYNPPKKFDGSCLDGRDITYNIVPDAEFKFFITANLKTRAIRRYKEYKSLKKHISLKVGYLLQGYSSEHNNWSWWWGPIDIFPGQNITNDTIRRDGYFNRMTISLSVLF